MCIRDSVWSAQNNAFFEIAQLDRYREAGWNLTDVVEISDEVFAEFTAYVDGKERIVSGGLPAWGDIPPPTQEQLIADAEQKKSALRTTADAEIAWRQDAVSAGIATDDEIAELAAWRNYRVLLMRVKPSIPEWPPLPA